MLEATEAHVSRLTIFDRVDIDNDKQPDPRALRTLVEWLRQRGSKRHWREGGGLILPDVMRLEENVSC